MNEFPFAGGVDLGLYGLARAIDRFSPAREAMLNGKGAKAVAIVLGEALWWVSALDDFFRTELGDHQWFGLRHADPNGQCVAGLLYARNLHSHQLAPLGCIADDHRRYSPAPPPPRPPNLGPNDHFVVVGPVRVVLAWRELRKVPTPAKPETRGRDTHYAARVATRPLIELGLAVAQEVIEDPAPIGDADQAQVDAPGAAPPGAGSPGGAARAAVRQELRRRPHGSG